MSQVLYSKSKQRLRTILIIILILLLLFSVFLGMGVFSANNSKILKGVYVNSIDIGNMTKEEASAKLEACQKELNSMTYVLAYGNREVEVSGEAIGLKYSQGLVEEAFKYGKDGNVLENSIVALKSLFNQKYVVSGDVLLDDQDLAEKLTILLEEEKAVAEDDSYEISGDKIFVVKGHDGVVAKQESVKQVVLANSESASSRVRIEIETEVEKAERVDFDKIYEEVYVEKKDATYIQKEDGTSEFQKEIIGVSFDKDLVETEYLNLADGETLTINLKKESPKITTVNLDKELFGEILATYKTTYNASNVNRSTNLEVAGRNINGTILLPGEVFSYNKEVGQRTVANGFREAHVFAGGKVVDGLGGGICQISSTLYNSVLMANLEIVERKNHMMFPEYVKPSLDATVVWGSIDFKFKNNRETPIKIVATVKNGTATVTIYGKKVKGEPIVELQSVIEKTIPYTTVTEYDKNMEEGKQEVIQDPVNGYVSKAYKILKDENGKEISKTLISSDSYRQTSKIVKVGTKKVEKPVEVITPVTPEVLPVETPNTDVQEPDVNINSENNPESDWPTGWDTPENPYYNG